MKTQNLCWSLLAAFSIKHIIVSIEAHEHVDPGDRPWLEADYRVIGVQTYEMYMAVCEVFLTGGPLLMVAMRGGISSSMSNDDDGALKASLVENGVLVLDEYDEEDIERWRSDLG